MGNVLVIGAGAAGSVVVKKMARNRDIFKNIHLASRTLSKCEKVKAECDTPIEISQVDADNVEETAALISKVKPDIVVNMALPYQDLPIMDACLKTSVHYMDTANYEPKDEAKFHYGWQWAYQDRFRDAGLLAVLGCGFDPGVTNIFCAHAKKHHFDEIHTIDIVDCNAGNHGQAFATNFNPEINIREVTQRGKYWEQGKWVEIDPLSINRDVDYPGVGPKDSYLIYHEELESIVKNFPHLKRIRFWMTFSRAYITHLEVLQNVGMTRIDPVMYEGREIIPLQFLKAVLPEPSSLAENYTGKTSIGCVIEGTKDGKRKKIFIYNICDHAETNKEIGAQAVSYTTGVPAFIGAMMVLQKKWGGVGVKNVEDFDPDPFMKALGEHGLPWHEIELPVVEGKDPLDFSL